MFFDVLYLPLANCNTFVTKHGNVYCKSKIYSHFSSWFLITFVLVQVNGILEVTAYELGPSKFHMNSGLLKGDLRLFLDVFACSRAKL